MKKTDSTNYVTFYDEQKFECIEFNGPQFALRLSKLITQSMIKRQIFDSGKKMERDSYHNKIVKWILQQSPSNIQEIFTISQTKTVQKILARISQINKSSQIESLPKILNLPWFKEKIQGKSQYLKKIKIVFLSQPIVYMDPIWSLSWMKDVFNQTSFFYAKDAKLEKKDSFMEYELAFYLRSQILSIYKSGTIGNQINLASQIKDYASKKCQVSSQLIKRVFQTTLQQAIQGSIVQYRAVGEQIESKYYKHKQQQSLLLLNIQEERQKTKKTKRKQKRIQQKKKQQQQTKVTLQQKDNQILQNPIQLKVQNNEHKVKEEKEVSQKSQITPSIKSKDLRKSTNTSSTSSLNSFINFSETENQKRQKSQKEQQILIVKPNNLNIQNDEVNKNLSKQATINIANKMFIQKYQQICQQNEKILPLKNYAYQLLFNYINMMFPYFSIQIFGSMASQVSLPNSDIDILLTPSLYYLVDKSFLSNLAWNLNQNGWVSYCEAVLNAKIPVIKLIIDPFVSNNNPISGWKTVAYEQQLKAESLIKIDISLNTNGPYNSGVINTSYMKEVFEKQPKKVMECFKIIKNILHIANLHEGYKGGINSYSLFTMLICFIEEKQIDADKILHAQFIMRFFNFFAKQFDFNSQVLKLNKGGKCVLSFAQYCTSKDSQDLCKTGLLKIVDPVNNILIRASFSRYKDVISLFKQFIDRVELMQVKGQDLANKLSEKTKKKNMKAITILQNQILASYLAKSLQSLMMFI